jgi:nitrilase
MVCQTEIGKTANRVDISNNVDRVVEQILIKATRETKLIVLPELSTIHYGKESFDKLELLAEDLFGPTFEKFSQLAKQLSSYIIFGFPRKEKGNYYISQAVINNEGKYQDHYDKLHIAQIGESIEKEYFTPGSRTCVFNVDDVKFGIIICYDFRFPILTSVLRKKYNVDVIVHPCAFFKDTTYYSWHNFVITRALENLCYFISINRAGEKWGNSIICPPWVDGEVKPEILDEKEHFIETEIDLEIINKRRKQFPFLQDENRDIQ